MRDQIYELNLEISECPSEKTCELVNSFLDNPFSEKVIYYNIDQTRQEIEDKEKNLIELIEYIEKLKSDLVYLKNKINDYYEEIWPGWKNNRF